MDVISILLEAYLIETAVKKLLNLLGKLLAHCQYRLDYCLFNEKNNCSLILIAFAELHTYLECQVLSENL